jgi:aminoglycoside phosphotransferase family enzyme
MKLLVNLYEGIIHSANSKPIKEWMTVERETIKPYFAKSTPYQNANNIAELPPMMRGEEFLENYETSGKEDPELKEIAKEIVKFHKQSPLNRKQGTHLEILAIQ